jgi:hypothetical protein
VPDRRHPYVGEAGVGQPSFKVGRRVADADDGMCVGVCRLDQTLEAVAKPSGHRQIGPHERVAAVDGRDHQPAAGPQPAAEDAESRLRVGEMLDGEAREDHIERRGRECIAICAEVDRGELVKMGQCAGRRWVNVGADEARDAGPEGL